MVIVINKNYIFTAVPSNDSIQAFKLIVFKNVRNLFIISEKCFFVNFINN